MHGLSLEEALSRSLYLDMDQRDSSFKDWYSLKLDNRRGRIYDLVTRNSKKALLESITSQMEASVFGEG